MQRRYFFLTRYAKGDLYMGRFDFLSKKNAGRHSNPSDVNQHQEAGKRQLPPDFKYVFF